MCNHLYGIIEEPGCVKLINNSNLDRLFRSRQAVNYTSFSTCPECGCSFLGASDDDFRPEDLTLIRTARNQLQQLKAEKELLLSENAALAA